MYHNSNVANHVALCTYEMNIIKKRGFGFAVHLTCAIHLQCNVKQQLQDRKFQRTTLDEVFGARRGSLYFEGLININSCKECDEKLAILESAWKARDQVILAEQQGFFEWFQKYKAEVRK